MKNVPVNDVPPADNWHAELENRPVGVEVIVQVAESPLLNCPVLSVTVSVVPGGFGDGKVITGALSMVKLVLAESPLFPVTVIVVAVLAPTETPTVNVPVTFPALTLQV